MTQKAIRRGSLSRVKEPVNKLTAFVEHYNKQAPPFVWVATADSILAKLERLSHVFPGHGTREPLKNSTAPCLKRFGLLEINELP